MVLPSAAISADRADYFPGQTALITGSGFVANEVVTLNVVHSDTGVPAAGGSLQANAGPNGTFTASWYVDPDDQGGHSFTVAASGATGDSAGARFSNAVVSIGPRVATDRFDYQPGATALIVGSGFDPGEVVTLSVIHSDTGNPAAGANPLQATADANGSFTANWYVNPVDSVGANFTLSAVGGHGHNAATTFTDANFSPTVLQSFEGGSLPSGWTLSQGGVGGVSLAKTGINPTDGSRFGFIDVTGSTSTSSTGVPQATIGSILTSAPFTLGANASLSLDLNFLTNDGTTTFSDFAYVELIQNGVRVATLYNANTTTTNAQAVPAVGGPQTSGHAISSGVTLSPTNASFDGATTGPVGSVTYGPTKYGGGPGGATGWVTTTYSPAAGTYQLRFVVSDVGDTNVESGLAIDNVRVVNSNTPPVLTSPGNQIVNEQTPLTFALSASDVDHDNLTYSIVAGSQSGMSLTPDGHFSWTPSEAQDGSYSVTFGVSDGNGGSDQKTINITVNEVNTPPTLRNVPTAINGIIKTTTVTFTASATDPDTVNPGAVPNTLTFGLQGDAHGATIDSQSGLFTWTPSQDQDAPVTFTVTVSDQIVTTTQQVTISTVAAGIYAGNLLIVGHSTADSIQIDGTDPSQTHVTINGSDAGTFNVGAGNVIVHAYEGDDTVTVNGNRPGTVTVDGGAGVNSLIVNTGNGADAVVISNSQVAVTGGATVNYSSIATLTTNSVGGADAVTVNASGAGLPGQINVNTGGDDDQVTVNLGGAATSVSVDGGGNTSGDTLAVNGTAGPDSIAVNGSTLTAGGTTIGFTGIENLTAAAGAGTDAISVTSVNLTGGLTLTGGDDVDSVSLANVTAGQVNVTAESIMLNGAVATTGSQAYYGPVNLAASLALSASGLAFADTVSGAYGLTVNSGGTTSFAKAVNLASLTTDAGGTTAIGGGSVTTTGAQCYNDAVILSADTVLTASAVKFASTVDADGTPRALAVNAAGATTFGGAVGAAAALASLTTDAAGTNALNGGSVRTTGGQSYGDPITLGADAAITGGGVMFGGSVTGAKNLSVTSGGAISFNQAVNVQSVTIPNATTVTFGGPVTTVGDLTQTAGGGTTTLNGASIGGALSLTTDSVMLGTAQVTTVGAVNVVAQNAVSVLAGLNAGASTISIKANHDNTGSQSFTQGSGAIVTSNGTMAAVTITVEGTGNAYLWTITTGPGGKVTVTAGGAILDNSGGTATITAGNVALSGGGGVGTVSDPIATATGPNSTVNLVTFGGTGGVYESNSGSLTVQGSQSTGDTVISAHSPLTVTGPVSSSGGTVTLSADEKLSVAPSTTVSAGGGDVNLTAPTVSLAPTASVTATGNFDLAADNASLAGVHLSKISFNKDNAFIDLSGAVLGSFTNQGQGSQIQAAGSAVITTLINNQAGAVIQLSESANITNLTNQVTGGTGTNITAIGSASIGTLTNLQAGAQINASGSANIASLTNQVTGGAATNISAIGSASIGNLVNYQGGAQINASGSANITNLTNQVTGGTATSINALGSAVITTLVNNQAGAQINAAGSANITNLLNAAANGAGTSITLSESAAIGLLINQQAGTQITAGGSANITNLTNQVTGGSATSISATGSAKITTLVNDQAGAQINAAGSANIANLLNDTAVGAGTAITLTQSAAINLLVNYQSGAQINANGSANITNLLSATGTGTSIALDQSAAIGLLVNQQAGAQINANGSANIGNLANQAGAGAATTINATGSAAIGLLVNQQAGAQINANGSANIANLLNAADGSAATGINASGSAAIGLLVNQQAGAQITASGSASITNLTNSAGNGPATLINANGSAAIGNLTNQQAGAQINANGSAEIANLTNSAGNGPATLINANGSAEIGTLLNQQAGALITANGSAAIVNLTNTAGSGAATQISAAGSAVLDYIQNDGDGAALLITNGGSASTTVVNNGNNANLTYLGAGADDVFVNDGRGDSSHGNSDILNVNLGEGNNRFVIGGANLSGLLTGGAGNNSYMLVGGLTGSLSVHQATTPGANTLDLSNLVTAGNVGANVDLTRTDAQTVVPGLSLTLSDAGGLSNVIGTKYGDTIRGNGRNSTLSGAELPDDRTSAGPGWNNRTQYVLLDFDTDTNQKIVVNADGGTFKVMVNGVTSGDLPSNISADALKTALSGIVGAGNVLQVVQSGSAYTLTFKAGVILSETAITVDGTNLTEKGGAGSVTVGSEHIYTPGERTAIRDRLNLDYHGPTADPNNAATWWFHVVFTTNSGDIPSNYYTAGNYVTVYFNRPRPDSDEGPSGVGGDSSEIDFGNQNYGGWASVEALVIDDSGNPIGVVGVPGQPPGQILPPAGSGADPNSWQFDNWTKVSSWIAAHEVGHLMGLRHADSFGPMGFGISAPPGISGFFISPTYDGPSGAYETNNHIIATPPLTGFSLNDLLGDTYFGEREAVKLSFDQEVPTDASGNVVANDNTLLVNENGRAANGSISTSNGSFVSTNSLALNLMGLDVPNTLVLPSTGVPNGLNSGKAFSVAAEDVRGRLNSAGELDVYTLAGRAGDLLNIQVMSEALSRINNPNNPQAIDALLTVYDSHGNVVASSDDEFEDHDPSIIDLRLTKTDTYYVVVQNSLLTAHDGLGVTGNYELFTYRFSTYNPIDGNDTLIAGTGNETLAGGMGDDTYVFNGVKLGNDTINENPRYDGPNNTDISRDKLDFSSFGAAINLNLGSTAAQTISAANLTLTLSSALGIEDVVVPQSANATLTGNGENNTFIWKNRPAGYSGTVSDTITGGGGMDTLDFSALTAGVTVNLGSRGSQTVGGGYGLTLPAEDMENVAGSMTAANNLTGNSLTNILIGGKLNDQLTGGSGKGILIGNDGDDSLVGSAGDDILVGGNGADRIVGSAGSDIMIAGWTDYDLNNGYDPAKAAIWLGILAEWENPLETLGQRQAAIAGPTAGTHLNGGYYLKALTTGPGGSAATVHSDTSVDKLSGSSSINWFFVDNTAAVTLDNTPIDTITGNPKNSFFTYID
jgi:hypothetical protein